MRRVKRFLLAGVVLLLTACTQTQLRQIVGKAMADQAETQIEYGQFSCATLRQRCVQGEFQEWQTSYKEIGCSCKKL